jgi:hypothetical protein
MFWGSGVHSNRCCRQGSCSAALATRYQPNDFTLLVDEWILLSSFSLPVRSLLCILEPRLWHRLELLAWPERGDDVVRNAQIVKSKKTARTPKGELRIGFSIVTVAGEHSRSRRRLRRRSSKSKRKPSTRWFGSKDNFRGYAPKCSRDSKSLQNKELRFRTCN